MSRGHPGSQPRRCIFSCSDKQLPRQVWLLHDDKYLQRDGVIRGLSLRSLCTSSWGDKERVFFALGYASSFIILTRTDLVDTERHSRLYNLHNSNSIHNPDE